jgi:hypothetical protein
MTSTHQVLCSACGFTNRQRPGDDRCSSCGARFEVGHTLSLRPGDRRFEQEGFSLAWLGISFVACATLTLGVVMGLPQVVTAIDLEGSAGMLVSIPIWFCSGLLIGGATPRRTFAEPVLATLLIAIPTAFLLFRLQTVKTMPAFMYVLMSALGLLFTLIGAYLGNQHPWRASARTRR